MNDVYKVVTPENIELDYEIAGIGSRFVAICIDIIIQSVLLIGILYSFDMLNLKDLKSKITEVSTSLAGAILISLLFIVFIGYYIILETVLNGQTFGKKLLNIRVRKEGGYAPTFWDILLRNLVRVVDMLPFFYALGLIVMFSNRNSKRLGDFAAGTLVVKELPRHKIRNFLNDQFKKDLNSSITESPISYQYPWLNELIPYINQTDYLLLRNLYTRRNELTNIHSLAHLTLKKIITRLASVDNYQISEAEALPIIEGIINQYEHKNFM